MGEVLDISTFRLREQIRSVRQGLPETEVARRSAMVCARVASLPAYRAAGQVVVYAAVDNEIDPAALAGRAAEAGKRVYYPASEGVRFLPGTPASLRRGGARFPVPPEGVALASDADDVLFLIPAIAFDLRGVRLGRGGGWYDRALARHPGGIRVGLAHDFQVAARLPEAPWDVRVHAVVTEARYLVADGTRVGQLKESDT